MSSGCPATQKKQIRIRYAFESDFFWHDGACLLLLACLEMGSTPVVPWSGSTQIRPMHICAFLKLLSDALSATCSAADVCFSACRWINFVKMGESSKNSEIARSTKIGSNSIEAMGSDLRNYLGICSWTDHRSRERERKLWGWEKKKTNLVPGGGHGSSRDNLPRRVCKLRN